MQRAAWEADTSVGPVRAHLPRLDDAGEEAGRGRAVAAREGPSRSAMQIAFTSTRVLRVGFLNPSMGVVV